MLLGYRPLAGNQGMPGIKRLRAKRSAFDFDFLFVFRGWRRRNLSVAGWVGCAGA
jgi:hypothetical protein